MNIIEKNKGRKITYEVDGTVISFSDVEKLPDITLLTLDLAEHQEDWDIHLAVCYTKKHTLTIGRGGVTYVAEIDIPARVYAEPDEENGDGETVALPLDMEAVTLSLWSIEEEEDA